MKLLLPLLSKIGLESGFGMKNPAKIIELKEEPQILVQLWKDFEVVASKKVSFQGKSSLRFFVSDIFTATEMSSATMATAEFALESFSMVKQKDLFKTSYEGQVIFRDAKTKNSASVLYDFLPDKKAGHTYTPILHSAHTAYVSGDCDSYAIFVNFRPPYLKAESKTQTMNIQAKSAEGEITKEQNIEIAFNDSTVISFSDFFSSLGGFKPGAMMNFRGGASQFAIFTIFRNHKTGSLGIEHSLPPFYYCSGVMKPDSRKVFYKNAFQDHKNG